MKNRGMIVVAITCLAGCTGDPADGATPVPMTAEGYTPEEMGQSAPMGPLHMEAVPMFNGSDWILEIIVGFGGYGDNPVEVLVESPDGGFTAPEGEAWYRSYQFEQGMYYRLNFSVEFVPDQGTLWASTRFDDANGQENFLWWEITAENTTEGLDVKAVNRPSCPGRQPCERPPYNNETLG